MKFVSLSEYMKHLDRQIQDTMQHEVAQVVADELEQTVQTEVYDRYDPHKYERRYKYGGMADRGNIEVTEIPNGIFVKNTTPLDNGRTDWQLDEIVNFGYGNQPFPRPFYDKTVENLEANGAVIKALEKGLKKRL